MRRGMTNFRQASDSGQSLLEAALFLPILVILVAFAVDFGYFFLVAANLTSSSRSAAEYSVQGFDSPGQQTLPAAGPQSSLATVSALAVSDLSGLLGATTSTTVEVCSKSVGTSNNLTKCSSDGPAGTIYIPDADPEAPSFLLNRVDVTYTVKPPIPLGFFSITLLPSLQFHRQVSMRALD
jgi:Flp pilus assembly protein TadG